MNENISDYFTELEPYDATLPEEIINNRLKEIAIKCAKDDYNHYGKSLGLNYVKELGQNKCYQDTTAFLLNYIVTFQNEARTKLNLETPDKLSDKKEYKPKTPLEYIKIHSQETTDENPFSFSTEIKESSTEVGEKSPSELGSNQNITKENSTKINIEDMTKNSQKSNDDIKDVLTQSQISMAQLNALHQLFNINYTDSTEIKSYR